MYKKVSTDMNFVEREKEVEKLKTSVEVIEYLKTVYANEYNEEYNTNVNKENVEITEFYI